MYLRILYSTFFNRNIIIIRELYDLTVSATLHLHSTVQICLPAKKMFYNYTYLYNLIYYKCRVFIVVKKIMTHVQCIFIIYTCDLYNDLTYAICIIFTFQQPGSAVGILTGRLKRFTRQVCYGVKLRSDML